ncbi:hypothetical protein Tco_0707760 [Tanacetum coccineum]
MAYPRSWIQRIRDFLEQGTLDIFQNIIFVPYIEYGRIVLSWIHATLAASFVVCGLWTSQVRSHHQNFREAGMLKDISGLELLALS